MHSERAWTLTKKFCKAEALVDDDDNGLIDRHGDPEVKVPNPRVELPFTYLMAWYFMHCLSLMTTVYTSKEFMPFLQKLEHSTWQYIIYSILGEPFRATSTINWPDDSPTFRIYRMGTASWTSQVKMGISPYRLMFSVG